MKKGGDLSIAESIRQGLARLTPTERKPAMALLANYPVPGLETVAQFARRAGVAARRSCAWWPNWASPAIPASSRHCATNSSFASSRRSPRCRRAREPRPDPDFLNQYGRAIIANIERSLNEVPRSEFKGTLDLLGDRRRRIFLVGGRFTASLALQFYLHLRELRPQVHLVSGQTATWVEHLLDFGRKDVLIAFDIRRYQDDVVRFSQEAAALGAEIVLFTDHWLSPIAAVARHVFALRTSLPSSWESFASLSALTEVMVARLQEQSRGEAERRMEPAGKNPQPPESGGRSETRKL